MPLLLDTPQTGIDRGAVAVLPTATALVAVNPHSNRHFYAGAVVYVARNTDGFWALQSAGPLGWGVGDQVCLLHDQTREELALDATVVGIVTADGSAGELPAFPIPHAVFK